MTLGRKQPRPVPTNQRRPDPPPAPPAKRSTPVVVHIETAAVDPAGALVSRAGWRWYGYGGHLVVSKRCAYHLATIVGGYLVSTIGAYYPKGSDAMETIGSGAESFFETFVFRCRGVDAHGNPDSDLDAIDTERYKTSLEAERGHYAICEKWHQRQLQ